MPFILWSVQYVGKNEPPFNITLNNQRKDVKDPKAILADKHFQKSGHRFNEHVRFTVTDRVTKTNYDKEILPERLIMEISPWSSSKRKPLDTKIRNSLS